MKNYFVILSDQQGNPVPMADPEGNMYFMETHEESQKAAQNTFFGHHFGFEIFVLGGGI
jgi:hypothetical protein